jgi:hypothetical protein
MRKNLAVGGRPGGGIFSLGARPVGRFESGLEEGM